MPLSSAPQALRVRVAGEVAPAMVAYRELRCTTMYCLALEKPVLVRAAKGTSGRASRNDLAVLGDAER